MSPKSPMSAAQLEILKGLLQGRVLEVEVGQFPYLYVLRKRGNDKGMYYSTTPVRGLVERGLLLESRTDGSFSLSPEGRQVAAL